MTTIRFFACCTALLASNLLASPTSRDFTCSNDSAQISCSAATCEVETEGFTPMSVARAGNTLQVCAYSGCWSGMLDLIIKRGDVTILHARLEEGQGLLTVSFNDKEQIATMLWGNFAQALNCGER